MNVTTLIHNTTPEQITGANLKKVEKRPDELKNNFQPIRPMEYLTYSEVKTLLEINLNLYRLIKDWKFRLRIIYKRQVIKIN